jgi:hypothetical protein
VQVRDVTSLARETASHMPVLRTDVAGSEQTDDGSDQTDEVEPTSKVEPPSKARERAIEAITDQARVARAGAPHSRAMWIAAGSVLVISVIACVAILLSDGEPTAKPQSAEGRLGFSPGIVIGIAIGILIGFAIAKQRNRD